MLKQLEIFDANINCTTLEFRPWAQSYRLYDDAYPYNDTYYIGIRIRGGKEIHKEHVDLCQTRRLYYDKIAEKLTTDQSGMLQLFESPERPIDLRISYKTRAQLPDEVRPKDVEPAVVAQTPTEPTMMQGGILGKRQAETSTA